MSEQARERTREQMSEEEHANAASRAEQANEQTVRANKRTSEWPGTLRVDSIVDSIVVP